MNNFYEYWAGALCCSDGLPCPENETDEFVRGYSEQYAIEQQQTHYTEFGES